MKWNVPSSCGVPSQGKGSLSGQPRVAAGSAAHVPATPPGRPPPPGSPGRQPQPPFRPSPSRPVWAQAIPKAQTHTRGMSAPARVPGPGTRCSPGRHTAAAPACGPGDRPAGPGLGSGAPVCTSGLPPRPCGHSGRAFGKMRPSPRRLDTMSTSSSPCTFFRIGMHLRGQGRSVPCSPRAGSPLPRARLTAPRTPPPASRPWPRSAACSARCGPPAARPRRSTPAPPAPRSCLLPPPRPCGTDLYWPRFTPTLRAASHNHDACVFGQKAASDVQAARERACRRAQAAAHALPRRPRSTGLRLRERLRGEWSRACAASVAESCGVPPSRRRA